MHILVSILDACATVNCNPAETCQLNSKTNAAECRCLEKTECLSNRDSVCGSNGVTYLNECEFQMSACQESKNNVTVVAKGDCLLGKRMHIIIYNFTFLYLQKRCKGICHMAMAVTRFKKDVFCRF